eukprot:TRINITY_DN4133_c0_g1_i1.p1 TRINITY_DN4133_c0_g1~~TRINITY_DN4133_c0_g1_i1.p1  ORF type:complete len:519 (+),score=36.49 TRINITY_DN4133_c0_g1_i1:245-1801(+)
MYASGGISLDSSHFSDLITGRWKGRPPVLVVDGENGMSACVRFMNARNSYGEANLIARCQSDGLVSWWRCPSGFTLSDGPASPLHTASSQETSSNPSSVTGTKCATSKHSSTMVTYNDSCITYWDLASGPTVAGVHFAPPLLGIVDVCLPERVDDSKIVAASCMYGGEVALWCQDLSGPLYRLKPALDDEVMDRSSRVTFVPGESHAVVSTLGTRAFLWDLRMSSSYLLAMDGDDIDAGMPEIATSAADGGGGGGGGAASVAAGTGGGSGPASRLLPFSDDPLQEWGYDWSCDLFGNDDDSEGYADDDDRAGRGVPVLDGDDDEGTNGLDTCDGEKPLICYWKPCADNRQVYSRTEGRYVHPFTGHSDGDDICSLSVTSDLHHLFTISAQGGVRVWDMHTGEGVACYSPGDDEPIALTSNVAQMVDGTMLVYAHVSTDYAGGTSCDVIAHRVVGTGRSRGSGSSQNNDFSQSETKERIFRSAYPVVSLDVSDDNSLLVVADSLGDVKVFTPGANTFDT